MQRLFSTFPNSWPGLGLLLLRGVAAVGLLATSGSGDGPTSLAGLLLRGGEIVAAGLLLIGLWTPFASLTQILLELGPLLSGELPDLYRWGIACVAMAIAMLGPGAWSVDARIFGRRRIDVRSRESKRQQ